MSDAPPSKPVPWKVSRRDGQCKPVTVVAQTAWGAYKQAACRLRVGGVSPSFGFVECTLVEPKRAPRRPREGRTERVLSKLNRKP
jgi:hypothetical protein